MTHHRPAVRAIVLPGARGSSAVTAYLIPGPRPTLVDAGPCTAAAESALLVGLQHEGLRLDEIRQVFVTHSHASHCGGVARVVRLAGAKVIAHPACLAAMADWPATCRARAELLRRAGRAGAVPPMVLEHAAERLLRDTDRGASCNKEPLATFKATGHLRAGSGSWNVLHTPGHTRDHLCLYHVSSGVLLSGDVLARDGAAVPWLEPRRHDGSRPGTLSAEITSWRRLARLSVGIAWPGHGPPIRAHRMLIARRLAGTRSLVAGARSALLQGATSVWDVMVSVHSHVDDVTVAATLSRTVAALDWLVARGEATRLTRSGLVLYRRAPPRPRR